MIVRPRLNWLQMLFVWRGSVLNQILPRLVFILLISVGAVVWRGEVFDIKVQLNPTPFTLIGVALAIFLGFRNSTSYDRFWEARKLWGSLLNDSRSLARQVRSLGDLKPGDPRVREFVYTLMAVAHALRHQLRGSDPTDDLKRLLPAQEAARVASAKYRPVALLDALGQWVRERKSEGLLDSISAVAIDQNLSNLSTIVGGCERIAGTPLPVSYAVMIHRTVYIYCILLPFGLVDNIGWMTPVMSVFVAYSYMALEALAGELEDPFGTGANDLALDAMSRTIESSLREIIGEEALEDLPIPDSFIVL